MLNVMFAVSEVESLQVEKNQSLLISAMIAEIVASAFKMDSFVFNLS